MKRRTAKWVLFSLMGLFALVLFSVIFASVIKKTVMAMLLVLLLIAIGHYLVKLAKNLNRRKA